MKIDNDIEATLRIALMWHAFGHDNLGVDALSRANATMIEAAAAKKGLKVEFVTLGFGQKPFVPDLPTNVSIGPRPSIRQLLQGRSQFLKQLRESDIAIDIGEGDSFTDIYGRTRFGFQSASKLASILLRQPLILAPQTIGPFSHRVHRWIATWLMNRATAVYARDYMSTVFLDKLKIYAPRDEFVDVAFCLPFERVVKSDDRIRVGINVSGLLYNGGYTGANELGMTLDYAALTDALIVFFQADPNVEISLFSHVAGGGGRDDDAPAIKKLCERFPEVVMAPHFGSSVAAKSWISGLDFVISGRMHACIAAYSSDVPVVPVAYSRKFNGLFGTLGYPYFVDGKATTTEKAFADVTGWFNDRTRLKAAIKASRPIIDERLQRYEMSIGDILESVAGKKVRR